MQRCPYLHEMRERLLDQPRETLQLENMERANLLDNRQSATESHQVGTVVKLQGDGYHTSPAHQRTPLVPHDLGEDFNLDFDDDFPIDVRRPKNANGNHPTVLTQPQKRVCYTFKPNPNKHSFMPAKITVQGTYQTNPITGPIELWTSLFIVTSLVYAILLIVVCIAYVISDVTTHRLPVLYYETFFTYLYGTSILFLLYVFCFLLQESSCCNGGNGGSKPKPQPKEKKSKKTKNADPADSKDAKGSKDSGKAGKGAAYQEAPVDAEVAVTPKNVRKRKTTHSDLTHGSFFLRVGAIAFGLGAMIYIGLEFGSFFEIPFDSPCHHILIGVNPLLQMIFTFMQMYFIFMNARTRPPFQLNIHRFKVIARFGLMHVVATNICVWIRTLVKESLLEITIYHQKREADPDASSIAHSIRQHALRHAGTVLRTHAGPNSEFEVLDGEDLLPKNVYKSDNVLSKLVRNTVDGISKSLGMGGSSSDVTSTALPSTILPTTTTTTTTTRLPYTTPGYQWHSTTMARKLKKFITSTTAATSTVGSSSSSSSSSSTAFPSTISTSTMTTSTTIASNSPSSSIPFDLSTTSESPFSGLQRILSSAASAASSSSSTPIDVADSTLPAAANADGGAGAGSVSSFLNNLAAASTPSTAATAATATAAAAVSSSTEGAVNIMNNLFGPGMENSFQTYSDLSHDEASAGGGLVAFENLESLDSIYPAALSSNIGTLNSTACGRIDIMGTIVYDSAPYLYPFIIEYSLIGAVVLYVMWKHIGRYPGRMNDEDLEHRLEVMLSRRAVAMAQQARSGRVDCVGSSKGLFFGLLLLVGALICLILFFVLVRHQQFSLLAIYLADASHCILMAFAILAIIIGFIRVKNLKFRCEEQSNLNDILLRISAFGLFTYSVFSIIAGSLKVLESEPSLLVTTTGGVAVFQVILQLLFIADVSRRRVHLPEHDRSKPGRQIVTFLLICNVAMFAIYTFEAQKVFANPVSRYVQLEFYGFVPWSIIQRITLPLCIFHRFHSAVTLAEIWKTTYKARLE
ncbi:proton channel OtopLc isoform X1 [Drosophila sulfurigaster albostrigata]|uniref:proton channel OtopLc isoform X1 n=1 Tax=Drosophila sulfurigaster albostrigata TaxID=89887 RepID=UPI002D21D00E|nr:proton channel OtopLc isoform X1 [Drosophila sulfurigaster albostrigata]